MTHAVEASGLTKRFGDFVAVDGIDLAIPEGISFGLLGPNGAGKTTAVRLINGFLPPTSGSLKVLGRDVTDGPRVIKAEVGVAPQEDNLDPDLSVLRNLLVYARYFGIPRREARRRARELIEFVGLTGKTGAAIRSLSGGLKRRLIVARALINQPRMLILDEPTTGLDPQARHAVWDRIRELKRRGTTIILTTHYMEEAERLCDWLCIMDHGRILVAGDPEGLILEHLKRDVVEVWQPEQDLLDHLEDRGATYECVEDRVVVYTDDGETLHRSLREGFRTGQCLLRRGTLEDVFLKLTGRGLRE